MGGFNLTTVNAERHDGLRAQHLLERARRRTKADYVQHHAWFQYFAIDAEPCTHPPDFDRLRSA